MSEKLLQGFYLGEFLVEPLTGQVTGRAGARHLPPKAIEVLLCLVKSPNELVTRETLIEVAWGEGHGSSEALSHVVSEIRHALDDHADDPTFVQTLPRRGYRLVVDPVLASEHSEPIPVDPNDGGNSGIGLFENLQQRGVLETAIAYLVFGWLLIQIADIVFAQLHLPEWAGTFVTLLVIAGFPIAIVLSWFLEFRDGRAIVQRTAADVRKQRFSRTYLSVIGALIIGSVLVYFYDKSIGLPQAATTTTVVATMKVQPPPIVENSFAVLPFLNLDGSDTTQIFAGGLVDDIITQLSRVPGLRVASRGDAYSLKPNSASQEVRNRLRVEMYLEGSVEMAADMMRVTVQMIDSANGFHILSRKFDRPRKDFFKIRDDITRLTVANVRVALPPDLRAASLKTMEDPSLDAYFLYRRGIDASREPTMMEAIVTALGWFDESLEVDPEYAAAHAGKCVVYVNGYNESGDTTFIAKAEAACGQALALNPNLDIVHTALGRLYTATGLWDEAESAFLKALTIDPSNVESLTGLGTIYTRQNRPDEAEASLRKAIDIHPGDYRAYNRLGTFLFGAGRFAEAAEQYQYVVAIEPTDMKGLANLGAAYTMMNDFTAAMPVYQKVIETKPTKTAYSNLGLTQYYLGNTSAAIESHMQSLQLLPDNYLALSNLGDALWVAGRKDEARLQFRKAQVLAEQALEVNSNDPFTIMDLAWINAMLDQHSEARVLINRARGLAPDDPYSFYYDGMVFLRAGDRDAAITALEKAAEKGYSRGLLGVDPHLEQLRNDPRFAAVVNGG